ncbi:MAG: rhodanese-like domain-containing protein [Verrucomicrobia bacterium]|nr:rhodanese-like domain-containing protein [Verrucomicrobiota bacterium]
MKEQSVGQFNPADAAGAQSRSLARKTQVKRILSESLLLAVVGTALAFAANEISPRGLRLTTDYFPGAIQNSLPAGTTIPETPSPGHTNVALTTDEQLLAARLQAKGLQLATSDQAAQLYRDPRYGQELIVFIDARNDWHYQQGHIPGAYQFDHYRAADYLATVLPVCQTAELVVVYCTGGDCEDSEFAAIFLRQAGIPAEKLLVYVGGMAEWTAKGLPVAIGARHSGNLRPANP